MKVSYALSLPFVWKRGSGCLKETIHLLSKQYFIGFYRLPFLLIKIIKQEIRQKRKVRALESLGCNKLIMIEPLRRTALLGKHRHFQDQCKYRLVKQLNNVINFTTTSVFAHQAECCYVLSLLFLCECSVLK